VKIRAVTATGPGPNSTEIVGIPAPRKLLYAHNNNINLSWKGIHNYTCIYRMYTPYPPPSLFLPPPPSATARRYQPLNFLLTQNAVIAVGAILCGALLITILVLAIGLLVYLIRQRRVKTGKHETLVEEEQYEKRQRRREKRRKV
jgi:hypothetical protein